MALLLPVLALLALEGVCRLLGYGGHPPILKDVGVVEDRHYVATVPAGIGPFFSANPTQPGSMDQQFFTMPKGANTVRIVLVGGSAMQGYPQPRPLKLSAFLQAMLEDLWPERSVEVINLGTTAIASFPAACIAREALDYDIDLLIVYSGNNEFYGAGGVASAHRLGRTARAMRTFHRMRRSALVQALTRRTGTAALDANENLMDAVFAEAQIAPDDPRREAAARNLADNIAWIIDACRQRGAAVMVCTCPGNERDLAPIGEDLPAPLPRDERQSFERLLQSARARLAVAPNSALNDLDEAARMHDVHATLHHLRGRCLRALGRSEEAAGAFVRARDLDTMPWRAPSASNEAIRRVVQAHAQAVLCDLEREFQRFSPGGSTGWELMDDHVHPSLAGQALVARAILRAMDKLPPALRTSAAAVNALADDASYAARLGANSLDAYRVMYRVTDLFERSFFRRSNPEALMRFEAERKRMEATMSPRTLAAVRRLQHTRAGVPITGAVAEADFLAGEYSEAASRFAMARRCEAPYAYSTIRYGCLELESVRRGGTPPANGLSLENFLSNCQVIRELAAAPTPRIDAFAGWALGRMGHHPQAVELLEMGLPSGDDPLQPVIAGQLVTSLVAVGRSDDAREVLRKLGLQPVGLFLDENVTSVLDSRD